MDDKMIIELYKKGIKFQYLLNIIIVSIFIGLYIIFSSAEIKLETLGIPLLIGAAAVLAATPIQWKRLKKQYEEVMNKAKQ